MVVSKDKVWAKIDNWDGKAVILFGRKFEPIEKHDLANVEVRFQYPYLVFAEQFDWENILICVKDKCVRANILRDVAREYHLDKRWVKVIYFDKNALGFYFTRDKALIIIATVIDFM